MPNANEAAMYHMLSKYQAMFNPLYLSDLLGPKDEDGTPAIPSQLMELMEGVFAFLADHDKVRDAYNSEDGVVSYIFPEVPLESTLNCLLQGLRDLGFVVSQHRFNAPTMDGPNPHQVLRFAVAR